MWTWHQAVVKEINNLSPSVRQFIIEAPELQTLDFLPGQFVTFDLPIHEKRLKRWRSYSIASIPDGNRFELCIGHFPGGLASEYLFNQVSVGTELKFKGPEGVFTLPPPPYSNLVFICTGTGIVPFMSMIRAILHKKEAYSSLHLIFGSRHKEHILYKDELYALASENLIQYDIALSRETTELGIYHKGYVHQIYENRYRNNFNDTIFYICGWKAMVDEAQQNLTAMGVKPEQIRTELYG